MWSYEVINIIKGWENKKSQPFIMHKNRSCASIYLILHLGIEFRNLYDSLKYFVVID